MSGKKKADKKEVAVPVAGDELRHRVTIKLSETEKFYGIKAETVRKWIKRDIRIDGKPPLKAMRPGKDIIINRKEFELYIEQFVAA